MFAIDLPLEQLDAPARSMHFHMRMLVQQRDAYYEVRDYSLSTVCRSVLKA